jgi:hypothetical protein
MHTNILNYVFSIFFEKYVQWHYENHTVFYSHNLCDLFNEDHIELANLVTVNRCDNLCIFDFSENMCVTSYFVNLTYFFLQLDIFKLHVLSSLY